MELETGKSNIEDETGIRTRMHLEVKIIFFIYI